MEEEKEVSFLEAIVLLWRNTFNYKDKAVGREFWYIVEFNLVLGFIDFYIFSKAFNMYSTDGAGSYNGTILEYIGWVIVFYLAASVVPQLSLIVRRIHTVGKRGILMYVLLAIGVGLLVILFMLGATAETAKQTTASDIVNLVCNGEWV